MRGNWRAVLAISLGLMNVASPVRGGDGEQVLDFHAIHRQTKAPLSEVALTVRVTGEDYKRRQSWEGKTDSRGFCRIKLPDFRIETLRLYPQKEGFVPLFVMWRGMPVLPKVFTVAMEPSTTIGGVVKNERGEPIEDVAMGVHYQTADPDAAENVHVEVLIHNAVETNIKTDEAGRWTFDKMPAEIDKNELRIFLKHPRYLSDQPRPGYIPLPITRQPSIEKLRDFTAVMVMKEGFEITGKITDKAGNPIAGAKIFDTEDYWRRSTKPFAETDAQGRFSSSANPGTATWTVQAPGYAPDLRVVPIREGMPPFEIRLEPGGVIEGKVTDQAGKPIERVTVFAEQWRQSRRRLHLEAVTDAEGNFRITDAPADEVIFDIGGRDHMVLEGFAMKPGKRRYHIMLRPALTVSGAVVDAQTGQPIDKFTMTYGIDPDDGRAPGWQNHAARKSTNGRYERTFRQKTRTYRIRIDAEGYRSAVSRRIRPEEISQNHIVCDFTLDKAAAATGTVLSPDGTPLAGADVVIATHFLRIVNGKVVPRPPEQNLTLHTDANGVFRFEPPVSFYMIVVLSERGYAKVTPDEFAVSRTITVSPWGRIEGTLRIGARPGAKELLAFLPESRREEVPPRIRFEYEVQTDENGHFAFLHVLPDKGLVVRVTVLDDRGRRYSRHIGVEVTSGQTTRIEMGGIGRPVVGRIIIPDMIKDVFDWQYTDRRLRISSPDSPPYNVFPFECDKDGAFRVEDVPAGDYWLYVNAYGPPPNTRRRWGEPIGVLSHPFNIPEMPGGRSDEPLDLGELEFEVLGKSVLVPSLIGKPLPDLDEVKIEPAAAQAEGTMILVCFFDMNQRPSRHCVTQLAQQAEQLKQKGVTIVAVQASKVDESGLREWVKANNIPFPVGTVQGDEEKTCFSWGVKSLPWLILTDHKHVVVSEGFQLGDLDDQLE